MSTTHTFQPPCGPIIAYRDDNDGVIRARGIPYASAERFHAPEPCSPWSEPFDGAKPSPACPQPPDKLGEKILGTELLTGLEFDEHCHGVSVTVPSSSAPLTAAADGASSTSSTALPVLVWIYGGAYTFGAGDSCVYDASKLVREQNIIVVMPTYRVGLFGYIGDGGNRRPANLGLLDQIAALRWVQTNIAAFGGDPRKVTVAGQSAGGDAVVHLLACEQAPDLFTRAIIQSAPLGVRTDTKAMRNKLYQRTSHFDAQTPAEEVKLATNDLVEYARRYGIRMAFGVQYGLAPLPAENGLENVWKRNAALIDILIGSTRDETSCFMLLISPLAFLGKIPLIGRSIVAGLTRHFTRKIFEDDAARFAKLAAQAGGNVFLYTFSWHIPGNFFKSGHAIELHLEFGSEKVWKDSLFLKGASSWTDDVEPAAVKFRDFLGGFIKEGGGSPSLKDPQGSLDNILTYNKIMT